MTLPLRARSFLNRYRSVRSRDHVVAAMSLTDASPHESPGAAEAHRRPACCCSCPRPPRGAKARLADVAEVGTRVGYEHDFGDSWEHELLVEACAEVGQIYPACTGGEGACPPADAGGYPGYLRLKENLVDPPTKCTKRCEPGRTRRPARSSIP